MIDIDECLHSTDGCEQACVNTEGSFTCDCFAGYELINATQCEGTVIIKLKSILQCQS